MKSRGSQSWSLSIAIFLLLAGFVECCLRTIHTGSPRVVIVTTTFGPCGTCSQSQPSERDADDDPDLHLSITQFGQRIFGVSDEDGCATQTIICREPNEGNTVNIVFNGEDGQGITSPGGVQLSIARVQVFCALNNMWQLRRADENGQIVTTDVTSVECISTGRFGDEG